jgi:hydrogenase nickel incorporation protein HypA/HybF
VHELAIAEAVVDIASRHAAGRHVRAIELRIGHLRQVVPSALDYAFEVITAGTELDGVRLEIAEVPARGVCRECGVVSTMREFPLQCSRCEGLDLEVVSGEELLVDALELEEAATVTSGRAEE